MGEFWLWFARPFAEFAGFVALVVGLFLLYCAVMTVLWTYHWVRRKIQSAWSGGGE